MGWDYLPLRPQYPLAAAPEEKVQLTCEAKAEKKKRERQQKTENPRGKGDINNEHV